MWLGHEFVCALVLQKVAPDVVPCTTEFKDLRPYLIGQEIYEM